MILSCNSENFLSSLDGIIFFSNPSFSGINSLINLYTSIFFSSLPIKVLITL